MLFYLFANVRAKQARQYTSAKQKKLQRIWPVSNDEDDNKHDSYDENGATDGKTHVHNCNTNEK